MDIFIEGLASVNHEKLNEDLTALAIPSYQSIGTRRGAVVLHVLDNASQQDIAALRAVIEAHDSSILTANQQARKNRQDNLDTSRGEHPNEIDLSAYSGESPLIRQLAKRIQWLDREVRRLRNGN